MPPIRAILILLVLIGYGAVAMLRPDLPSSPAVIDWSHDLAAAEKLSLDTGQPLLLLTDNAAGREARAGCFAHPIITDAVADLFIPVIVSSEAPSAPLMRILDGHGGDLVPALGGEISAAAVVSRLITALRAAQRDVPAYLQLVDEEYNPAKVRSATFAVGCYWEGEEQLGKLPGVVSTRTGILNADEVVQVEFDASRVEFVSLLDQARHLKCFHAVRSGDSEKLQVAGDQLHTLASYPEYQYLPLTPLQATRVNSALADHTAPEVFLSPSQRRMHEQLHEIVSRQGADALEELRIDRSPAGLGEYAQALRHMIAQLSDGPMLAKPFPSAGIPGGSK